MKALRLAGAIWMVGLLSVPGAVRAQSATTAQDRDADKLPPTIPLFPLPNGTFFPNVAIPFHIFELRYRAMITDALRSDRIIGIVLLQPGTKANYAGRPAINPIGCAGVITDVVQLPDGRFNIWLRGLVKFRVTGEDDSRPYRLAHVVAMPEPLNDEERTALRTERERLEALLATVIDPAGSATKLPLSIPDEDFVNQLAQDMELTPIERQALLEEEGVLPRARLLIDLLELRVLQPR